MIEALVFGLRSHVVRPWTRISAGAGFRSQHCLLLAWWPQALGLTFLSFHVLSRRVGICMPGPGEDRTGVRIISLRAQDPEMFFFLL